MSSPGGVSASPGSADSTGTSKTELVVLIPIAV